MMMTVISAEILLLVRYLVVEERWSSLSGPAAQGVKYVSNNLP